MSRSNKLRKLNNADAVPNIIYNADGSPVRKVCFSFEYEDLTAQQNITDSLLGYVIRIGQIESLHLSSSATRTKGYIQFEQPEHATQLLNQSGRSFAGAIVHFRKYENMFSLDEIFRYLDVNDLLSVAQRDERFKQNAITTFSRKFGAFCFSISDKSDGYDKWKYDIYCLENVLPVFGEFVERIYFDYRAFDPSIINRVLELFALHCSDKLKELSLTQFRFEDALVSTIEPLLARLTSLDVAHCEVSNRFIESLTNCRELNHLQLWDTTGDFQSFQFTFPKLETIDFGGLNQQQMEIFLSQNPQLKNVNLFSNGSLWSIFSAIGQYLPQVEMIDFCSADFIDQPTFRRNAFASLKGLSIECENIYKDMASVPVSATISALAAAQPPLEYLTLLCSPDDQLIDAIAELKTIKTLRLMDSHKAEADYSISRLLHIIDNLKELDYLALEGFFTLNADGLMKIVQNANKLQSLELWTDIVMERMNAESWAALVEIIKNRAVNRHLEIIIEGDYLPPNTEPTHEEFLTFSFW